jgi:DNA-3-methyladenine glycosylase I
MVAYHDLEWGVPVTSDSRHFEFLVLDGFQAGLSWRTILYKRENFRRAFADFDVARVARFRKDKVERLMKDAGIVRNRLKIEATLENAKAFLRIQKEFGSFNEFVWSLAVPRASRIHRSVKTIPAKTTVSEAMSKELLARGFRFVGPTICYAYMQAAGMVNDHVAGCFVYRKTEKLQQKHLKTLRV